MISFKWRLFLHIFLATSSPLFLLAHLASPQAQPNVDVSLQVRSGLPDPGWVITNLAEIAQLRELIKDLPSAAPVEPPPFGAFLLVSNESISGFPQTVLVFNGIIEVSKADRTTQAFQDTKGLKQFLVSKAVEHDICADSDRNPTVVIDGCDSGVPNLQLGDLGDWCTISDKISQCAKDVRNHGQFVSCVAHLTNDLQQNGTISGNDKGKVQSCAAKAKIP